MPGVAGDPRAGAAAGPGPPPPRRCCDLLARPRARPAGGAYRGRWPRGPRAGGALEALPRRQHRARYGAAPEGAGEVMPGVAGIPGLVAAAAWGLLAAGLGWYLARRRAACATGRSP